MLTHYYNTIFIFNTSLHLIFSSSMKWEVGVEVEEEGTEQSRAGMLWEHGNNKKIFLLLTA